MVGAGVAFEKPPNAVDGVAGASAVDCWEEPLAALGGDTVAACDGLNWNDEDAGVDELKEKPFVGGREG